MTTKPVPFHKGMPIFGALPELRNDQLGFLRKMHDHYGDIVEMSMFTQRATLLSHPDYIQSALVEHADKIQKSPLDHAVFEQWMGSSLFISEGAFHKRQRKLMQPAFHHKRIEAYGEVTTDFTARMMAQWHDGMTVDIHDAMTKLTLFVVSKVLYDADVSEHADGIGTAIHTLNHQGEEAYKRGFAFPLWLPLKSTKSIKDALKTVNAVMMPIIETRRKQPEDRGDLLSMLLAAQDEEDGSGMTDDQVRDEAVTLFIAGHETTSNALAWAWYLVSQNADVERKLHAELDTVLGGRTPTVKDLSELKYTEMVIKEAMRLYPPAWILNGRALQDDIEIDGYVLRKGMVLFISPYVAHRDARYFDNPDQFMPERWENDFEKRIPRYAYFPFGGGARICIGNSFAMMEARLVLAQVASQYRVVVEPTTIVTPEPLITLRPKGGIQVRLKKRGLTTQGTANAMLEMVSQ